MKKIILTTSAIALAIAGTQAFADLDMTVQGNVEAVCEISSLDSTMDIDPNDSVAGGDVTITCNDYDGVQLRLATTEGGLRHTDSDLLVPYTAVWTHDDLTSSATVTLTADGTADESAQGDSVLGAGGELAQVGSSAGEIRISYTGSDFMYGGDYSDTLQLDLEAQ